jgi:hypothetical protein
MAPSHLHLDILPELRNTASAVRKTCLWEAKTGPSIRITTPPRIIIALPDMRTVLLQSSQRLRRDLTLDIQQWNTRRGILVLWKLRIDNVG